MTNVFLIKALAVALTLSQILNQSDVRTEFDRTADQAKILEMYKSGCKVARTVLAEKVPLFKFIDLGKFLEGKKSEAASSGRSVELSAGFSFDDARTGYQIFCLGQVDTESSALLAQVIDYYNLTLRDLPDVRTLIDLKLPEFSRVLEANGQPFTAVFRESHRQYLTLDQIPVLVQNAFLAAEDQHFYDHGGVDPAGVIRAAIKNMLSKVGSQFGDAASAPSKREEGGSTITQQLAKNLLVGDKHTYDRKIREMVVAYQLEKVLGPDKVLSKRRILELYLNLIPLNRNAWGVGMGAQSYFGKPLDQLSAAEAALLAGLPKGPGRFSPDTHPDRSLQRTQTVLTQMQKTGVLNEAQFTLAMAEAAAPKFIPYTSPRSSIGEYFTDELVFNIKSKLNLNPYAAGLEIHSTVHSQMQAGSEAALQEGLAQFELANGRAKFSGAEKNLSTTIAALPAADPSAPPVWLEALQSARLPLSDVHWDRAIVLQLGKGVKVGLTDGSVVKLKGFGKGSTNKLKQYDVVYVQVSGSDKARVASLRFRPEVQGGVIVLENRTGRVVSMVGGFSHSLSQMNRTVHMVRQPGSTVKPLTYLAALNFHLQPNTLIWDASVDFGGQIQGDIVWSPDNYESEAGDQLVTLRRGLEDSRNRVTARLLKKFGDSPQGALDYVLRLMEECGVHDNLPRYWATIIGGIDVPMINMATCFATIANGGWRPTAHYYEDILRDGKSIGPFPAAPLVPMQLADEASYYQLRTIMQGVIARGTAARLNRDLADVVKTLGPHAQLSDVLAGKTGTSQNSNDTWFIGFTEDLTIAVWVGYDNATSASKKTLGGRATGATVAVPIFASVLRATLQDYPLKRLAAPSAAAATRLFPMYVNRDDGRPVASPDGRNTVLDYFRLDQQGNPMDTREQYQSRDENSDD